MKNKPEHDASDEAVKILKDLAKALADAIAEAVKDLKALKKSNNNNNNQENTAMADLSQLKQEISSLGSVTDAVTRLIDALVEKIQTGGTSQAEIDALVADIQANKQELVDAIANIPHPDNTLPGDQGQRQGR